MFAQEAAEEEAVELDLITVTGSRIKRVDAEGATPLTIISRENIENSGYATVTQVLRASAFNTFGSWTEQSGYVNGFLGVAAVDLRGLGAANTLVLLNGRRLAPAPGAGAEGQDLNQIPLDMVERIEILRDGASAIYGTDAIAGVVNIITRRDMTGVTASLQLEDPYPSGGESARLSVTGGAAWDRASLTYSLEYFKREAIYQRDIPRLADISAFEEHTWFGFPSFFLSWNGPFQGLWMADPRCPTNTGDSDVFPNAYRVDAWAWEGGYEGLVDTFCSYNYAADIIQVPETERYGGFLDLRVELSPRTRLVGQARFYRTETWGRYAAAPVTNPYPYYTADNPNNPMRLLVGQTITDPRLEGYVGQDTWTFTEEDIGNVLIGFRTVPNGPRDQVSRQDNGTLYGGLEGETDWFNGSEWALGLEYSFSDVRDDGYGFAYTPALQVAINDGSLDLFNVQGLEHDAWLEGTREALAGVKAHTWYQGKTEMSTFDGLLSFDAFQWQRRPVPVVLGFEYYDLAYSQGEDPVSHADDIADAVAGQIVDADRQVFSLFGEILLPLTDVLELNLAARYDHYSDFGSTVNPKVSLAWRPVDSWLFRASWGTGFRAPDMISLWEPRERIMAQAIDRVGCAAGVASCFPFEYPAIVGGNPDLEPYESVSWTAGVVWNVTEQLALELTYYAVEYTNRIGYVGIQQMFDREYNDLPHTVVRNADGTVKEVSSSLINLSGDKTSGVDFIAYYAIDTERAGMFDFRLEWTHPLEIRKEVYEGEGYTEYLDWVGYPEDRADLTLNWSRGALQATWVSHYISEHGRAEDYCWPSNRYAPCEPGDEWFVIDSYLSHDLQLAWNAPWQGQFALGARNLFNEEPPYHPCCRRPVRPSEPFGGSKRWFLYDALGRTLYFRYRHEF